MLVDIFSSFDEHNCNYFFSVTPIWLSGFAFLFMFFCFYWYSFSRYGAFLDFFVLYISEEVGNSLGKSLSGFLCFICSLFFMLLLMNFSGLIPYVFGSTSHLLVSLSFGLVMWLSLILSSFFHKIGVFLSHLLPVGTPEGLSPFLVLVETVSILVRPITLSVRLVANMSAGHIIIGLVGVYFSSVLISSNFTLSLIFFLFQIFYFFFEFGISFIQAYIFSLLVILYSNEHSF